MCLLIETAFAEADRLTLLKSEVQSPLIANREKTRAALPCCNTSILSRHPGDHVWKGKFGKFGKFCFSVKSVPSLKVLARGLLFAVGSSFFWKGDKQERGISPARSRVPAGLFHPTAPDRSRAAPLPHLPAAAWWLMSSQGCGSKGRDWENPASLWIVKARQEHKTFCWRVGKASAHQDYLHHHRTSGLPDLD